MASGARGLAVFSRRVMHSRSLVPARGGGGGPMNYRAAPNEPLPEEDELTWDDGTVNPEPALDHWANTLGPYQALGMWAAGMSVFYGIYSLAVLNDKKNSCPVAPREYPYDNLKTELGAGHEPGWNKQGIHR